MFLDASAVVAVLTDEPDASRLAAVLAKAERPVFYTSLVVYEAVVSIAKKVTISRFGDHQPTPPDIFDAVERRVEAFFAEVDAVEMPLEAGLHKLALDAARRYGRGTGHPARLNFGDCFSYASAKRADVPLLFTGADFSQTDIAAA
ncbi:type II toxin-antitoxin system VapC family toxin [Rhizobium sp. C4]|uniref:type II toxin-antitoxin system VapC family toxin n=1 Tax=Rhizobium sp. C4 TaxID=1349800 RepID=UPI001E29C4B6|nr:type II toxin-antitoxin system VapC family toxin [Rhizobium sp. C4]MCD2175806.1 type II toxin-antitoxin system VapC family toxin [Rhizobium sp. C4]